MHCRCWAMRCTFLRFGPIAPRRVCAWLIEPRTYTDLPDFIKSGFCIQNHRFDLCEFIERKRGGGAIANAGAHHYGVAATRLSEDADLEAAEGLISGFEPGEFCGGFVNSPDGINCIQEGMNLLIINKGAIVIGPLVRIVSKHDDQPFRA